MSKELFETSVPQIKEYKLHVWDVQLIDGIINWLKGNWLISVEPYSCFAPIYGLHGEYDGGLTVISVCTCLHGYYEWLSF
jgi:hypothetical protein